MTAFGQMARNPESEFEKYVFPNLCIGSEALDMTPEMLAHYAKTMNIPPGLLRFEYFRAYNSMNFQI